MERGDVVSWRHAGCSCRSHSLCTTSQSIVAVLGDAIAIAAPIGLFFGRLANFINGELWGRVTDVPWAIVFPQVELYARAYPERRRHHWPGTSSSQLYEAVLEGLVLFLVLAHLAWQTDALKRPGTLIGTFLVGYGLARAFCEFSECPMWASVSISPLEAWEFQGDNYSAYR